MKTSSAARYAYPYEEFADHIRAMPMVRGWQYTSRFGPLGDAQNTRASTARVVEYFSDCYQNAQEALHKAELFLTIHDYLGRNVGPFERSGLLEVSDTGTLLVDPALLRAVHHSFVALPDPGQVAPKKVLALARAFDGLS